MFLKNIDQPNLRTVRFSSELAQPKNIRLLCVELNQGFRLSGELSEDMWTVGPREEDGDGIHWCQKGFSKGCETTNLILFKCVLHMHVYIKWIVWLKTKKSNTTQVKMNIFTLNIILYIYIVETEEKESE